MTADGAPTLANALKTVIDPELGYNIVDIGLVYDAEIEDGHARILLTTTTPGCPATNYIRQAAEDCAASVPGVTSVDVTMTWSPPWSPDLMSAEAKAHFGVAARTTRRRGDD
jgi:metal-sulfur cluster biosynthetic enzyme